MGTNHTLGPWYCVGGAVYRDGGDDPKAPIAFMCRDDRATAAGISPCERDANARLIAACPDLLAALEAARLWVREYEFVRGHETSACAMGAVIGAAIAKARGE